MKYMLRLAGLLAAALPLIFASNAAAVPDASCPSTPPSAVIGQQGNNRAAQTFTAQNTGALTRAQVEIDKIGSAGDWILSINAVDGSGIPTDTILATTTIPDASVPDGVGTLTGDFASPTTVTAGQKYAVVYTRPASDTLRIRYSVSNPCPEIALLSFGQTGAFTNVCGPPDDPCDLVFAVFVEPPPPAQTPVTALQPVTPVATGKRAAALKRCKKKRGKARARCKRKAKQLPV